MISNNNEMPVIQGFGRFAGANAVPAHPQARKAKPDGEPLALDSLLQRMRHPTRKRSVVAAGFLAAMLQDSVQWHAGLERRAKYITEMVQEYDLEGRQSGRRPL